MTNKSDWEVICDGVLRRRNSPVFEVQIIMSQNSNRTAYRMIGFAKFNSRFRAGISEMATTALGTLQAAICDR